MTAEPPGSGATSRLLSSSAVMAAGTLVSRVLGLVRVIVLAWAIGVEANADPFAVANTLPNNLYILIGGGVLNAVLVPQIVRAAKHADGGQDYIDRLVTLAIVVLGGATVLATAAAPLLVRLYTRELTPEQVDLASGFALWCLPQVFFYGLYTIYGQILNARGSFGPYMWAPVVNNVVAIAGTAVFIALYGSGDKPASWWGWDSQAVLAGTATLGVVAQAWVLIPALRRAGYRWQIRWGLRGIGLRTAGRVAGWTLAGVAVGQLGFILISQVATRGGALAARSGASAAPGRTVYDNAYLLFFLPHSLVAVSLVTAVFTRMAEAAAAGRTDEVRSDVSLAVRLTGVATMLATAAFIVLGRDLAAAMFVGNPQAATDAIALTVAAMMIGLAPFSAMYLFQRAYYAFEDARTPFVVQVVVIAVWTAGSLLAAVTAPGPWVVPGIGLAMSVSNIVGAVLLVGLLHHRLEGLDGARILASYLRFFVAALMAAGVGYLLSRQLHALAGSGSGSVYLALVVAGTGMLAVYGLVLKLLRATEVNDVLAPVMRRLGGR